MSHKSLCIFWIAIGLWLTNIIGCSPVQEIQSQFPSQLSCQSTCWEGITPGKTSMSQVGGLLDNSSIVVANSFIKGSDNIEEWYLFEFEEKLGGGTITSRNGTVVLISLKYWDSIPLSQVIENDDKMYIRNARDMEWVCYHPSVVIPAKGLSYSGYECGNSNLTHSNTHGLRLLIEPQTQINKVNIFSPVTSLEMYASAHHGDEQYSEWYEQWNGYGEYRILALR